MGRSRQVGTGIRSQIAAKGASELAARQFGAVARGQLLALGFTGSQVARWHHSDRLHPLYPGVYALGREELGIEGKLMSGLLYAGPGAALGGISALWWLELLGRRPAPTRIDTPRRRATHPGLHLRRVGRVDRSLHRDLPVVPLPDALLASTGDLGHDSLRLVLARADFRNILDMRQIAAACRPGRTGSRALRAALAVHLPQLARCSNRFERDFVLLCERYGLPIPDPNVRIGRYRPDMLWPEARLIVELDGEDAHSSPAQRQADATRQAALEALGYLVVRFTWAEVQFRPDRVAASVRHLLTCRQDFPSISTQRSGESGREAEHFPGVI